jgi:isoquinoline 1-oxidoreductase beta subunit
MISRRALLVGGGAGIGLVVAWAGWPRSYAPNLPAGEGETGFGAYLKIARDGRVTVAVPQAERGQGAYTALAQIAADELGADWRTVGVEPAPLNPLYANPLAAEALLGDLLPPAMAREQARRGMLMLTVGSTSIRQFEAPIRQAAAGARALLCKAAAARWGVEWTACAAQAGFVTHGRQRLRFAELAEAAAAETLPDPLTYRSGVEGRLTGRALPRLDAPAKVDGSAVFAADVRLPDMAYASVSHGPIGATRLLSCDSAAADRVPGVQHVARGDTWVAAVGATWWAADRGLDALAPRFESVGAPEDAEIDAALSKALTGDGRRIASVGDLAEAFEGATVITAHYSAKAAVHAAIETPAAVARWRSDRLELWSGTDAPAQTRAAAARAIGIGEDQVILHRTLVGGSFGEALESDMAQVAAILAMRLKRPVLAMRSRAEALRRDRPRPPARARMAARLGRDGAVKGWLAKIAAPATGHALARRLLPDDPAIAAALALSGDSGGGGDAAAVAGAMPPYGIPAIAVDHHPVGLGLEPGYLRGGAAGYACFFTEGFLDELAHYAQIEALSFRIAMLGGRPRLARCLSTAAALGGWNGGVAGSGQGIACFSAFGSHIAVLADAHVDDGRIRVDRLVAAVDCGRQVNPDLVRQQIEGGLVFGMAAALGGATGYRHGIAVPDLHLPRLADTPDITVELIESDAAPGGVSELAVPPVAPAIANAVHSATGLRLRALPLRPGA